MSTPSIAERVAAGVAWLDAHVPGWLERIDLEDLAMVDPCWCVMGQLFGDYENAPLTLGESVAMGFDTAAGAAAYPFTMAPDKSIADSMQRPFNNSAVVDEVNAEFADLTAEWRRVIQERRQAAGEAS